jgi:hypothetical protein
MGWANVDVVHAQATSQRDVARFKRIAVQVVETLVRGADEFHDTILSAGVAPAPRKLRILVSRCPVVRLAPAH